jgi:hypothetical protein
MLGFSDGDKRTCYLGAKNVKMDRKWTDKLFKGISAIFFCTRPMHVQVLDHTGKSDNSSAMLKAWKS